MLKAFAFFVAVLAVLPTAIHYAFRVEFEVHDKGTILISGASSGIGKHAALHLDGLGFTVFAGVRNEKAAAALVKESSTLKPIVLDVTKPDTVASTFAVVKEHVEKSGLPFVGLVNNAGVSFKMPFELVPMSDMEWLYDVNVFGVVRLTQPFLPLLRASKGRIVNIASLAGLVASPFDAAYSSSKFALESMSDALRREQRDFGVHVAVVEPGFVLTPIAGKATDENSPFKKAESMEQYGLYREKLEAYPAKRKKQFELADTPEVTSTAIVDALTNAFPLTRYPVANAGGIPAKVVAWMAWAIPDYMADAILTK